ncbi:RHS repeat domain-containing protein [Fimbriiglobus ruber]|uniref:RHS repeat domain-containing protein n=1 Tax=Fimbriiglobus ruber TaxID=1908690 RepID=UPI00137A06A4|nr:RHS repeat-associated core domain-containing protein [Fimbriiglobus ruber]
MTDPLGLVARTYYDALGRTVETVADYTGAAETTTDVATEYTYDGAGHTLTLTADEPGGAYEQTAYVYGATTAGGSGVNSNDLLVTTEWPDPTTGAPSTSQEDTQTVNALGQVLTSTDRNGSTHTLTYDVLGRVTSDAVTTLGSGVDGSVRRIATAYDTQGNAYLTTSYNAASGGSVVNQVEDVYNGLDQLTGEYQAVGGVNNSRMTSTTYPDGYVVTDNYASGLDNTISRLTSLSDTTGTLESYKYLGLDTVVERDHPESGVNLTDISQTGSTGDAGDQYTGLDRFGRVVDQNWYDPTTSISAVDLQYGYDADGNVLWRNDTVNTAFGEVYTYDGLNQLATFARGTLNGTKTGISGTASATQSWTPDALGNFTSVTTNGTAQSRTANAQNEITAIGGATTPTYDANGNMTTDETGLQYVYDAWNRLVMVKSSGGTTLETNTYDGKSRLVTQTVSGTTTNSYYSNQWQVLEQQVGTEYTTRNVWSPVYVNAMVDRDTDTSGTGLTATGSGYQRLWPAQDANWNVVALVNGSATVVERYTYQPFGAVTVLDGSYGSRSASSYAWTILFQGMAQDAVSGLDQANRRWYSETQGRWMTTDPLKFAAEDNNFYRTEGNAPVDTSDPSGLRWTWSDVLVGAGTALVVAGGVVLVVGTGGLATPLVVGGLAVAATAGGVRAGMYAQSTGDAFEYGVGTGLAVGAPTAAGTAVARFGVQGAASVYASATVSVATGTYVSYGTAYTPTVTLYRGVNSDNFAYPQAQNGVISPNWRWWYYLTGYTPSYPGAHNFVRGGTTLSPYTSWTTDPEVAINFALRPSSTGVVVTAEVPVTRIVTSPNTQSVTLIQNGKYVSEAEVLVTKTVYGTPTAIELP